MYGTMTLSSDISFNDHMSDLISRTLRFLDIVIRCSSVPTVVVFNFLFKAVNYTSVTSDCSIF